MDLHKERAFVCSHVLADKRPVLEVLNLPGEWQLLCGGMHTDGPKMVGLSHLVERDPSLRELLDLPEWWVANRSSVDATWSRRALDDKERAEISA